MSAAADANRNTKKTLSEMSKTDWIRRGSSVDKEDVAELKAMFDIFDSQGKGELQENDLKKMFSALGFYVRSDELAEIMAEFSTKGNITFEDFQRVTRDKARSEFIEAEELKHAFELIDKSGNGFIEKDELKQLLDVMVENHTEEDVENLMQEADTNGDGRIDYDEFVNQIAKKKLG